MAAPRARGQTSGNWNVDSSGNWSTAGNWSSDPTVPGGIGSTIGLNNNIGTSARTVTIDTTSRTAGILNIGDSNNTHSFILAASGGGTLTLDNSGSGAQINESGSLNDTISAPLILADGLSASVAGSLTISGNISETGGAKSVTKSGNGRLVLSGNNSYMGTTIIRGGNRYMHEPGPEPGPQIRQSWFVLSLPQLEQQAAYDRPAKPKAHSDSYV
jgi:autotransporter-associated beta strand protein